MSDVRLVVVSCPRRKPLQEIWCKCFTENWPDCPYPVDIISPAIDVGWNANLIAHLERVQEPLTLLLLDDHFIEPGRPGQWTENMQIVVSVMTASPDIAMIKLQAGNAHAPEIPFKGWDRIREYDRRPHPFKRTNLVPTMYRREWLHRLSYEVWLDIGPQSDKGRNGALEFEVTGTKLTEDATAWPERMLGIHRPNADGGGGDSLLLCMANDGVREGRIQNIEAIRKLCVGVQGIEAFL